MIESVINKIISPLNRRIFIAISVFLTLVLACIKIYEDCTDSPTKVKHKKMLLNFLMIIKAMKFEDYPQNAAMFFTKVTSYIFGSFNKRSILDKRLWNFNSVIFFSIFAYLISFMTISSFISDFELKSFYLIGPTEVLFVISAHLLIFLGFSNIDPSKNKFNRWMHEKTILKALKNKDGLYLSIFTDSILSIFSILFIFGLAFSFLTGEINRFFMLKGLLVVAFYFHVLLILLSFNITRLLVYLIGQNNKIWLKLKFAAIDVGAALIIAFLNYIVLGFLVLGIELAHSEVASLNWKINFNLIDRYFFTMFLSSFIPTLIFSIFIVFEIVIRVFVTPFQSLVVFIYERMMKSKAYLYVLTSLLLIICAQLIELLLY